MRKTKNQKEVENILFGAESLYINGRLCQASPSENDDGFVNIYSANYKQTHKSRPVFVLTPVEIKKGVIVDEGVEIYSKSEGIILIEPMQRVPVSFIL